MAKKLVITIARQYGSGGREIGEKVAEKLGIPLIDEKLITESAAKGNLDEEVLKNTDETAVNSLLYTLAMGSTPAGAAVHFGYNMPLNDKLFILQSEVIREHAEKGSCVIIGRCADYVLKDECDILKIFIYSDIPHREERIKARHPELKPSQVLDTMTKTDKRRSSYYNFYTGNKWGKHDNYDLSINSATFGIDKTAELISNLARTLTKED